MIGAGFIAKKWVESIAAGGEFGYALNEFVSAIAERRAPEVGLDEHIRSLAIAFALIQSGRTGRRVVLAD